MEVLEYFLKVVKAVMTMIYNFSPEKHEKLTSLILFTVGAEVVVCCLRSSLGLAVTRANGFRKDSLSPCLRSMGFSEDREEEEKDRSVLHPCHLTHCHTQL